MNYIKCTPEWIPLYLSICMLICYSTGLKSQEKQVPFFPNQQVVTIDKNYAKKMSFFTEYENFKEARLYLTPTGNYALEIFYEVEDTLFKDRKVLSVKEKDAYLNELVRQYALSVNPEAAKALSDSATGQGDPDAMLNVSDLSLLNQKGRSTMLIMNTLAGLGYYGYAVPLMLNVEDDRGFVGLYMLASGASFYIPYRLTQRKSVTLAQASFNFYGISRGVMHGMFLGEILSKNPRWGDYFGEDSYFYSEAEYERQQQLYDNAQEKHNSVLFGMGIAGSISGGIAGYKLADRWDYDGGSTSIFQMWGDFGTISGLLLADVFDFYDNSSLNAVFGTAIATSIAGMVGGKFFGDSRNYTLGDGIVYRSSVALSTLPLITLVNYFEPEDETPYAVAGLAGIAAGSYFGYKATLNKDFETSDGVYIALGELAGGLLGLGLGYLMSSDFDSQLVLTTSTLGALGGYGLMYAGLSKNAVSLAKNKDLNVDFQLNPAGIMMSQLNRPASPALAGMYNFGSLKISF